MGNRWYDNNGTFEKMRQNFTTTFHIEGPNMTLPDMSAALVEMRDELFALREENARLRRESKEAKRLSL